MDRLEAGKELHRNREMTRERACVLNISYNNSSKYGDIDHPNISINSWVHKRPEKDDYDYKHAQFSQAVA